MSIMSSTPEELSELLLMLSVWQHKLTGSDRDHIHVLE